LVRWDVCDEPEDWWVWAIVAVGLVRVGVCFCRGRFIPLLASFSFLAFDSVLEMMVWLDFGACVVVI
jgi:hypothetical protein